MGHFSGLPYSLGHTRKAALASIIAISWGILVAALPSATAWAATADFVKTDATTEGSWVGAYGADGYLVSQDANYKLPSYAQITGSGYANWTWAASTTALPALQTPENPSNRIAGTWFATPSFTFNVTLTDSNAHQLALYVLDWDSSARSETINVLDAVTGAVLNSQILPAGSFHTGEYLVWTVTGSVQFQIVLDAGANAVISGLFFDTPQSGANLPPVNTALPVITGTAQVGTVLTSSTGTWTGATSFAYQWARNGTPIAGATASTYTPAVSDVGHTLTVAIAATGPGGTASATSAPTAPVASATAAPPADIQLPVISGTAQVGKVLTSSTGTWTGATSYAYQWATNNVLISGAVASTYTPVSSDAGNTLTATVTATGTGGTASATSAATVPIVAASGGGGGGGGGATYYVSKSGNDSNSGASNAPWLTIGHALATATTPGSTIIVGAGTYQELVRFTTSGTSGNPITLMANPGSSVTIDGGSASSGPDPGGGTGVVTFNNVRYVNLYGFNITNGYESCIYGTGSSSGTPSSANINVEFNTCNSSFSTSARPCGSGASCAIIANYWGQSWNVSNNYINRTNCSTNQHTLEYLGSYKSTISNNVIASNCNGDGIVIKNSGGNLTVTQNQVANLSPHFNACIYVDVESGNSYQNSCVVNNMTAQNNLCDGVSGQANGGQTISFNHEQACAGGTTGSPGDITNSTFTNNVLSEAVVNATNSYNPSGYPLSGTAISPNTIEAQAPLGLLFTASQYFVASGGSVTLSWSPMNSSTSPWTATKLSSCTASGGWSGSKAATSGTNTQTISGITTTTTYTLTCTDSAGSPVAVSIPITVPIP